jgi:hypothetical protein
MEETAVADRYNLELPWDYPAPAAPGPNDNGTISQTRISVLRCPTPPDDRSTPDGSQNVAAFDYRVCDQMVVDASPKRALDELIDQGLVKKRPNTKGAYHSMLWNRVYQLSDGFTWATDFAKMKQCTDGTSQTFMFFETGGAPAYYRDGVQISSARPGSSVAGETQGGDTWANYENWYAVHDRCGTSFFNCNNNEEIYSFHVGGAFFVMGDGSVRFVSTSIEPDTFVSLFTRDSNDVLAADGQ